MIINISRDCRKLLEVAVRKWWKKLDFFYLNQECVIIIFHECIAATWSHKSDS